MTPSLERNPSLLVAATYRRDLVASLERVWDDVFDWEHLPWLHATTFRAIERLAEDRFGWRARVHLARGGEAELELVARAAKRPHRLGPLAPCPDAKDALVCPWHGYRYDANDGRELSGRRLRLARAPRLSRDSATGCITTRVSAPGDRSPGVVPERGRER